MLTYESRCNARLQATAEGSTRLACTGLAEKGVGSRVVIITEKAEEML